MLSDLAFRNVDASPRDPVTNWPMEAIQTALERGGLSDWRRLAAEIRDQPWGTVARQVEQVLGYSRTYGIDKGWNESYPMPGRQWRQRTEKWLRPR